MQTRAIQVIGIGALNIDHICSVESIVLDGETTIKSFYRFPGGSAANTISALAKLGVNTGFVGAIGGDGGARLVLESFTAAGVETSCIVTKTGETTGVAICLCEARRQVCLADSLNRRSLYILPGANSLLSIKDIKQSYLSQVSIVHMSSFVDRAQLNMQKEIVASLPKEVELSFSPGALYSKLGFVELEPILKRCHVLFLNHNEAEELTGKPFEQAARELIHAGCKIVAITFGKGIQKDNSSFTSFITNGNRKIYIEPARMPDIKVVDTIGAGDAYAAGFIYGLLRKKGLKECGILGEAVARFSLRGPGARNGLPTFSELSLFYQDHYHRSLQTNQANEEN